MTWSRWLDRAHYLLTSPGDGLRLAAATAHNRALAALDARWPSPRVRCALCGWSGRRFATFLERHFVIPDSQCPRCGSQPRQRDLLAHLHRLLAAGGPRRCLDIAPASTYRAHLEAMGARYLSVDLASPIAMARMDVTRLACRTASCDLILCSHVLEHVVAVDAALGELRRVVAADGVAIVDVPRRGAGATRRIDPPDHQGHVWDFGPDVARRIAAAGFDVEEQPYREQTPTGESGERFFVCRPR